MAVVAVVIGWGNDDQSSAPDADQIPAATADDDDEGGGDVTHAPETLTAAEGDGHDNEAPGAPTDQPAAPPADAASQVEHRQVPGAPAWALPGVIELSDGTVIAGMLWTAGDAPLAVYVEAEKRWRRVPLAAALAITAVVVQERMEDVWRWKTAGEDEKIYSGEQYPFRRFEWTLTIADGSEITGVIKGQAIRVAATAGPSDTRILAERTKGEVGQTLAELIYVQRIIISRDAMEAVPADSVIDSR